MIFTEQYTQKHHLKTDGWKEVITVKRRENGYGEYKVTKWQDWVCPICGWFVGQRYNRSQNHSHDQRKCNYCNECGQKLDWSDENDD